MKTLGLGYCSLFFELPWCNFPCNWFFCEELTKSPVEYWFIFRHAKVLYIFGSWPFPIE